MFLSSFYIISYYSEIQKAKFRLVLTYEISRVEILALC